MTNPASSSIWNIVVERFLESRVRLIRLDIAAERRARDVAVEERNAAVAKCETLQLLVAARSEEFSFDYERAQWICRRCGERLASAATVKAHHPCKNPTIDEKIAGLEEKNAFLVAKLKDAVAVSGRNHDEMQEFLKETGITPAPGGSTP